MTNLESRNEIEIANEIDASFAKAGISDLVRDIYQTAEDESCNFSKFWRELAGTGWLGFLVSNAFGGQGRNLRELVPFLEKAGQVTLPGPYFVTMLVVAPILETAGTAEQKNRLLPLMISGNLVVTAPLDGWKGDNILAFGDEDQGFSLRGKAVVADADIAQKILLPARGSNGEVKLFLVDLASPGIQQVLLRGVDRTRRMHEVSFDDVIARRGNFIGSASGIDASAVERVLARACVALCVEMVGVAQRATDISVEYARARIQFGKPIGSFQAVKHKCVDMLLQTENMRALTYRAIGAIDRDTPDCAIEVAAAKAYCSVTAKTVISNAIQVHGGIGYTWDHETNRLYRRAFSSEAMFGGWLVHRAMIADAVMDPKRQIKPTDPVAALDLTLNHDDAAFREELQCWLIDNPADFDHATFEKMNHNDRFEIQRTWQKKLHSGGWMGIEWIPKYGGRGANLVQQVIYNHQMNCVDGPGIANDVALAVAAPALIHWGTAEQRLRYLAPMLSAEEIWCQGYSERSAGSDLASLQTVAVEDGDDYLVTGGKIWTTIGHLADFCILLVRTDPDAPKHQGISCLILDMRTPGITLLPLVQLNGDAEFAELLLKEVRIPKANLIGSPGLGWQVALTSLGYERAGRSNAYKLDQSLRDVIEAVRSRRAMYSDAQYAVICDQIAGFYIEIQALRHGEMLLLAERLRGAEPGERSSIAKIGSSELVQRIAHFALDVLDAPALGFGGDEAASKWQRLALTSRYYTIASGTSEVQRNILGERVLGLPKR